MCRTDRQTDKKEGTESKRKRSIGRRGKLRERERERDRQTDRQTETDRQTDRQTDRLKVVKFVQRIISVMRVQFIMIVVIILMTPAPPPNLTPGSNNVCSSIQIFFIFFEYNPGWSP